jgi:hypothetical protein
MNTFMYGPSSSRKLGSYIELAFIKFFLPFIYIAFFNYVITVSDYLAK